VTDVPEGAKALDLWAPLPQRRRATDPPRPHRDEPRQAGAPLNFLIYPYAEVDGKPHAAVAKEFAYRTLARSR